MKMFCTAARCTLIRELTASLFFSIAFIMLVTTYALAQNPIDIINFFDSVKRTIITEKIRAEWEKLPENERICLEQRGISIRYHIEHLVSPDDVRLSRLRFDCRTAIAPSPPEQLPRSLPSTRQNQGILSERPTFDCTRAKSTIAYLICAEDRVGAKADWDLISAYWARKFSLRESEQDHFETEHDNWFPALARFCRLKREQTNFNPTQRDCVLSGYRHRAQLYRAKLTGDALTESLLTPEQHVQIQQTLVARNYLASDDVDGEFGPNTRAAIQRFTGNQFLNSQQRQMLLQQSTVPSPP